MTAQAKDVCIRLVVDGVVVWERAVGAVAPDDLNVEMRARAAYEKMRDLVLSRERTLMGRTAFEALSAWEDQPAILREDWRAAIRAADAVEDERDAEIAAAAIKTLEDGGTVA